ncbi:ATP-binding protein [Geobacter sp. SVR]|uniref:ATP-binding protein n=1 Tax=Geobacter sp. SVR TaxID=2495594 RepID=UPI00143EFB7F|nr:ATP-binding protein [Geobacter sp. SVR]BCS54603.1 sensor histidine kinase [Geobacter sp. SVR]GCF86890.1 sensor histidine kinase [Geobacter sp. SVR]
METEHASANPAESALYRQSALVRNDFLVSHMMTMVRDGLIVLNEQGQILEANAAFLQMFGIGDKHSFIGQCPGEAIKCINAIGNPGCCDGANEQCSTCGVAHAVLCGLNRESGNEMKCVVTVAGQDCTYDLCLKVRSYPVAVQGQDLLFLFMQDITDREWRTALEQVFFHDINNIISGLLATSFVVERRLADEHQAVAKPLKLLLTRLYREIKLQKLLSNANRIDYKPDLQTLELSTVIDEIAHFFASNPVAVGKILKLPDDVAGLTLKSDLTILYRVLVNMLKNAFEATEEAGEVRLSFEDDGCGKIFTVWSERYVPEEVSQRLFKRHFSTKNGTGRGFGTYSMKLLAERFLKGKIGFSSSPETGTLFTLNIPADLE